MREILLRLYLNQIMTDDILIHWSLLELMIEFLLRYRENIVTIQVHPENL